MMEAIKMTMKVNYGATTIGFQVDDRDFVTWMGNDGKVKTFAGSYIVAGYNYKQVMNREVFSCAMDFYDNVCMAREIIDNLVTNSYSDEELLDILPAYMAIDGEKVEMVVNLSEDYMRLRDIDNVEIRDAILKGIKRAIVDYML